MNTSIKVLSAILCLSLFINPVWAYHTAFTDEIDFLTREDAHDNVGYLSIVNGSSAYLHNAYGNNATELLGNVTADVSNDIITTYAFLDNDLEETGSVLEIADDSQTAFWGGGAGNTLSNDNIIKIKGIDSLKIVTAGPAQMLISKTWGSGQDWSIYEFISLYFYGGNSGHTFRMEIRSSGGNNRVYDIIDNFSGWRRITFPLLSGVETGTLDLSSVTLIQILNLSAQTSTDNYIDRIVLDVGSWVGVEISVPDVLDSIVRNVRLFAWDGAAYDSTAFMSWDAENDSPSEQWDSSVLYFLDGSTINNIYGGDIWDYQDSFLKDARGQTKDSVHVSSSNVITYSFLKGVVYRVGFAVKMPPDDGQDSVSGGISQMRFKAEIYYSQNGETTVLHEGDPDTGGVSFAGGGVLIVGVIIAFLVIFVMLSKRKR